MIRPLIAITTGEPAGIGPELCAALNPADHDARLVLIGDRTLLNERARQISTYASLVDYAPDQAPAPGTLEVLHLPLAAPSRAGQLDVQNAGHVIALLDRAIAGCLSGEFAAMVTAPLHKGVIIDGGYAGFTGHTEYLAEQTGTAQVVMMLAGTCPPPPGGVHVARCVERGVRVSKRPLSISLTSDAPSPPAPLPEGEGSNSLNPASEVRPQHLRVALATTHLPLREVADAITPASLAQTLRILDADLRHKFGIARPRILVAGLNPHAGEGGHLGREEIDVIIPVLDALRAEGMQLIGPLPADTLFNPPVLAQGDAVLAMYHDQGLPVLKHATFGQGINVTLGLPLIRTSVDHGTALDLAGTGKADGGSLRAAIELAIALADSTQGTNTA